MITRKLTIEEQQDILNSLFGFNLKDSDGDGHFVLYDEEDNEFYAYTDNCQFDFSTLAGIFSYTANRAKNQGYLDCQMQLKIT